VTPPTDGELTLEEAEAHPEYRTPAEIVKYDRLWRGWRERALRAEKRVAPEPFTCKAQRTADPPQDCDWPTCGCDPYADKVIESLQESGKLALAPLAAERFEDITLNLDFSTAGRIGLFEFLKEHGLEATSLHEPEGRTVTFKSIASTSPRGLSLEELARQALDFFHITESVPETEVADAARISPIHAAVLRAALKGWEDAHALRECGHSRGDLRDPNYVPGRPETYTASEKCCGCESVATAVEAERKRLAPEWTPVTPETMPPPFGKVLCFDAVVGAHVRVMCDGVFSGAQTECPKPSHWMPLPAPPKEKP